MRSFFDLTFEQRRSLLNHFEHSEALNLDSSVATLRSKGAGSRASELRAYLQKLKAMGGTKALVIHLLKVTDELSEERARELEEIKPVEVISPPSVTPSLQWAVTPYKKHESTTPSLSEDQAPLVISYEDALKTVLSEAQEELWISTYSFHTQALTSPDPQGHPLQKLQSALSTLLQHQTILEQKPGLKIKLVLHLEHNTTEDTRGRTERMSDLHAALVRVWPTTLTYPELYCEAPHTLQGHWGRQGQKKHAQHSKVVIADERIALIGSANLSEAAYERNLEVGCLVRSSEYVTALLTSFKELRRLGHLSMIPLQQLDPPSSSWLSTLPAAELEGLDEMLFEFLQQLSIALSALKAPPPLFEQYEVGAHACYAHLVWPHKRVALLSPLEEDLCDLEAEQRARRALLEALTQEGWTIFTLGDQPSQMLAQAMKIALTGDET